MTNNRFLCRELSLLQFNQRVLAQAEDPRIPLLERLKFVCIVSSNLDEFFEVRVASVRRLNKEQPDMPLQNGEFPHHVLKNIKNKATELVQRQYDLLSNQILPALKKENIHFYKRFEWTSEQSKWIESYFHREIKPIITPIGLDPAHPFPKLLNKSLNFAVELEGIDAFGRPSTMAIVQAPRILPRIVKLPKEICQGKHGFVFLSSILHAHVHTIFLGMKVKDCYQFRVTRDSELNVDEVDLTNLRTAIQGELHDRKYGSCVRLEVATNCPKHVSDFLLDQCELTEHELYTVNGPVNLVRLMAVPDLIDRNDLKYSSYTPSTPKELNTENVFDAIKAQDILLHHPYQSFQPIVNYIQEAAFDPDVVAIKMTIYRTGKKSDLIQALIDAAQAGKEVTVIVELMARFDEEANVNWASQLENAGAHVVYGVYGYKVHAKMALVVRRENNQLVRYTHLGTGNYHQGTSKLYTDFGILTKDPDITSDVNDIFIQITGLGQAGILKKLYQSPFTLHQMIIDNIHYETEQAKAGKPAKIIAKMNSLVEPQVIEALYLASQAGVEIDLIVRGACVIKPGVKGLSENIRVRSIIGRLLEHSRIFYFYSNGQEKVYISSADWMGRNFFRRIETCTPVEADDLKKRVLEEGLLLALKDNQQAWNMLSNGNYQRISSENSDEINMQNILLEKYVH